MIFQYNNSVITELTSDYVEYLFDSYVPANSLIVLPGNTIVDSEIPSNISNIIFDDCTNPIDVDVHLKSIELKKFEILSGLYKYHKNKPYENLKFFPFWAVWMSLQQHKFSTVEKRYKLSCLNGTPWIHRQLTYIGLSKQWYFNDIVFTFKDFKKHISTPNEVQLSAVEREQLANLKPMTFLPADLNAEIDLSIDHPAYQETYINLVTETTVSNVTPMLSEKSFKPIAAGQLFLILAAPGAVQFLRDIGIDVFDDVIDHSYDLELDLRRRINQLIKEIDRLMLLDLANIYKVIKERLVQNSIYFNSEEFRKQFQLTFDSSAC